MKSSIYKEKNIRNKNKKRKLTKYVLKHPNDLQAKVKLSELKI